MNSPLKSSLPRGFAAVRFRYSEAVIEHLKQYPGARYAPEHGKDCWLVPQELQGRVAKELSTRGLRWTHNRGSIERSAPCQDPPFLSFPAAQDLKGQNALLPFQEAAIAAALRERSLLVAFEMGCGKSRVAIETIKRANCQRVLIVCPASVRDHWALELRKWTSADAASGADAIQIEQKSGWESAPPEGPITVICSYGLLEDCFLAGWEALILDEAHLLSNYRTARTKRAQMLAAANPDAIRLALTGTPLDRPDDLFSILNILWPGRCGYFTKFRDRYCQLETSGLGYFKVTGINPLHGDEFRARLSAMSVRATRAECEQLMPPVSLTAWRQAGAVPELAAQWVAESGPKCFITTRLRETAAAVAVALEQKGHHPIVLTGAMTASERTMVLAAHADARTSIIVATHDSVGIGIDLTAWPRALFTELDYEARKMVQLIGRFSRLSSKRASAITMLIRPGTRDEHCASVLLSKAESINQLFAEGGAEKALTEGLLDESGLESFAAAADAAEGEFPC